jgi:septal ring-binding cell division protein DamX
MMSSALPPSFSRVERVNSHTLLLLALLAVSAPLAAEVPAALRDRLAQAATGGDSAAARSQAELIVSGEMDGDAEAARELVGNAARDGDAQAATLLGVLAYRANDRASALRWWRQAAGAGHADAHYKLGLLLAGEPHQSAAADQAFEAAATQQHVLACFALGTRLATRDLRAARHWLECAARQGYAPAQFNLARLYSDASLDTADLDAARHWYSTAAPSFAPAAEALAALPPSRPRPAAAPVATPDPAAATVAVHDSAWVMAQPASAYTVQIASGSSEEVLRTLLRRELTGGDAACVEERPSARQSFSAIVGVYADRASAEQARAALPAALRANSPWVRRFSALQQALRDADKHRQADATAHAESN